MKYCKEKTEEICKHIENGMTYEQAFTLSDVAEATFYDWKKNKVEFLEAIKKAQAKDESYHISNIKKHSEKNWTASAWWLERRYKERYSERQEYTGKDGEPLSVKVEVEDEKEKKKLDKFVGNK